MIIEAGKSYRTRGGRRVEVIHVLDAPDENGDTIIGLLGDHEGSKEINHWRPGGIFDHRQPNCNLDIVGPLVPRFGCRAQTVFIVGGDEIARANSNDNALLIANALNALDR